MSTTQDSTTQDPTTQTSVGPKITKLDPKRGSAAGGSQVTITGSQLGNTKYVFFGSNPVATEEVGHTSVVVESPPGPRDTVDVYVKDNYGSPSNKLLFTYT